MLPIGKTSHTCIFKGELLQTAQEGATSEDSEEAIEESSVVKSGAEAKAIYEVLNVPARSQRRDTADRNSNIRRLKEVGGLTCIESASMLPIGKTSHTCIFKGELLSTAEEGANPEAATPVEPVAAEVVE